MSSIKVTSEELQSVSSQLNAGASTIDAKATELRSKVEALVSAGWNGAASQSFHSLYAEWNTAQMRLKESLLGISQALSVSAQRYDETEATNASSFRS